MSRVVDERIVSMQFDNKRFEANVSETMSTLDKLKQKLNLSGSAKGLEEINTAAGKVNMNGLAAGVEAVSAKFSALQVVGVTALANITNSAVNAAKRFVHALTVAPVSDGFKEYEMMLNSIQTTMAGTGKTAKEVELELKKLDEYADKTVYSTSDMLSNLPKFTNAGVALESATTAMIGIANATALAGGDASKASIAFYNLGQAISTGYLTRMDYNSINNAGIATMEWKEQMVEAAIAAGTLKKAGEDAYVAGGKTFTLQQLFIDGLQKQWATTDVMMKVFEDYGNEQTEIGKKAYAAAQDIKTYTQMMESLKATAGTGWKDTWQIIFGDLDGAKKFWTSLTNTISGVITRIADIRNKILDVAMGSPLTQMVRKIENITDTAKSALKPLKEYAEIVDRIIRGDFGNQGDEGDKNYRKKRVEAEGYDYATAQNLVNEKLGSSVRLTSDLTEAQKEQSKQQEKTIDQLADLSEEQLENLGYTKDQIEAIKTLNKYAKDAGVPLSEFIKNLDEMSGREMLIESFKNVGKGLATVFQSMKDAFLDIFPISAESIGLRIYSILTRIYEFTKKFDISENKETIDELIRTFKGLFAALDIVLTIISGPVKIAFKILEKLLSVFDLDILSVTARIGDAIVKFHDWFESWIDLSWAIDKIAPYLKNAVQAVKDWIEAVKPMEKIVGVFNRVKDAIKNLAKSVWESDIVQNIIDGLTNGLKNGATRVWNAIVAFAKGIIQKFKDVLGIHSPSTETQEIGKNLIEGLVVGIKEGIKAVGNIISALCSSVLDLFGNIDLSSLSSMFTNIVKIFPQLKFLNVLSGLSGLFSLGGKDITSGLANGLSSGIKGVWDAIVNIANTLIEKFKEILGIHSPSTVFFALGGFIIAGLLGGLLGGTTNVKEALKTIGNTIVSFFADLDIGTVIATAVGFSTLFLIKKILDIISGFSKGVEGIGKLGHSLGDLVDTIKDGGLRIKPMASKWTIISKAILAIAIAIGILAAAVVVMSKVDTKQLWISIGALAVVSIILGGLVGALMATTKLVDKNSDMAKIALLLLSVAAVMGVMVLVGKVAGDMSAEQFKQAGIAVAAFAGIMVALIAVAGLTTKKSRMRNLGGSLLKASFAILIMLLVARLAGSMDETAINNGLKTILKFAGMVAALMLVGSICSRIADGNKLGANILMVSGAILLMLLVARIAGSMDETALNKGTTAILKFAGMIAVLMVVDALCSRFSKGNKLGTDMLAIAAALFVMTLTAKIAGSMTDEELTRGINAVAKFGNMMLILMGVATLCSMFAKEGNIGVTLLAVSASIAILAGTAALLGMVKEEYLKRGILAVSALSVMVSVLLLVTSKAGTIDKGTLIGLAAVIGVLAVAIFALSFIPYQKLIPAVAAMGVVLGILAVVIAQVAKMRKMSTQSVIALGLLALTVGIIGILLWNLSKVPYQQSLAAAGSLAIVLLAMTAALFVLGKIKNIETTVMGSLAVLTILVGVLGEVLVKMAGLPIGSTIASAGSLLILITAITASLYVIDKINDIGVTVMGALAVMVILVGVLGEVIVKMAGLPIASALVSAGSLAVLLITLTASLYILSTIKSLDVTVVGAMAVMVLFVGVLGEVLVKMAGLSIASTIASAVALSVLLLAMVGAMVLLDKVGGMSLSTIASIAVMIVAVGMLAQVMTTLGALSFSEVAIGLIAIAGAFAVIGVAGYLLAPVAPVILSLGAAMLMIGIATLAAGVGLAAAAAGLANLASIGSAGAMQIVSALTIITMGVIQLIPVIIAAIGAGIIQFCQVIITAAPSIAAAVIAVGLAILTTISTLTPALINCIEVLLTAFLNFIVSFTPKVIDAAVKIIVAFLDGIASGLPKIIQSAINLMISFVNGLADGIRNNTDAMISAVNNLMDAVIEAIKKWFSNALDRGKELIQNLIDGVKKKYEDAKKAASDLITKIKDKITEKYEDLKKAGKNIIDGFIKGIKDKISAVGDAASEIGKKALNSVKEFLGIASPAKELIKVGKYSDEGFAVGLKKYAGKVASAAAGVGKTATNTLSSAVAKIARTLESDMDTSPTIRPVLDLSEVEAGVGAIGGMFGTRATVGVSANVNAVNSMMRGRQNGNFNDVVSAIDKLDKHLGNVGNTTYNFDGITYDDGSNINEAVRTIVRAARVGRRV